MRTHRQMDATSAKKIVDTFSDAVKTVPLMGKTEMTMSIAGH